MKYNVMQAVTISPNKEITLTDEQAQPRMHNLTVVDKKKKIYKTKNSIQFKRGEVIEIDEGKIEKVMMKRLEVVEEKKAAPKKDEK